MYSVEVRWGGRTNIREGVETKYDDVKSHHWDDFNLTLIRSSGITRVNLRHVAAWTAEGGR